MKDNKDKHYIWITSKCLVVLESEEIRQMLKKDKELFTKAIRRGKGYRRYNLQKEREKEKYERET